MLIEATSEIDKFYKALVERDSQYIGIFYVGVKTTGIFCISICRARKPKKENVVFYTTTKELLQNGYRPCKVCKPTENALQPPEDVLAAIELVKQNPKQKVKDYTLRQHNLKPEKLRRWFKQNHGITFHTYQRMLRINNAFNELKDNKNIAQTAHNAGYESLSGFGYTYKRLLQRSPNKKGVTSTILIDRFTTPLGPMFVCSTDKGICLLEFTDRRMLETEFKDLQQKLNAKILHGTNNHIKLLKKEIEEYFNGKRKEFTVPLHTPGTDFQQLAWKELINLKYGETSTYAKQATKLGKPNEVQAIISANGFNRISIIVPCHRLIDTNGALKGYGGGLERKKWLLNHEAINK